jgi:GntR family transcriptional regulator, arabinose operon transcriptional repressor
MYEVIYQELKEKILQKHFDADEKLPTEKELTAIYNVSRITTKKALDMLVSDDLVSRVPGRGTFIKNKLKKVEVKNNDKKEEFTIGYIVPDLDDSHGLELFLETEKIARQRNMNLVVKLTYGDINSEKQAIKSLLNSRVDGLIILPVSGEYYNEEVVK